MSTKFGIVAAMEREIGPWAKQSKRLRVAGDVIFYEAGNAVAVCGGIGGRAASRAAEQIVDAYQPAVLVSAGFAGALKNELRVADLFLPSEVVDLESSRRFPTGKGEGILATSSTILSKAQKAQLASTGATAVDMEAAAVAEVAQRRGLEFMAIKVISDELDFDLPEMDGFVNAGGKFRAAQFIAHVALRPRMWPVVRKLATNTARAADALSHALDTLLREGSIQKTDVRNIVRVDVL